MSWAQIITIDKREPQTMAYEIAAQKQLQDLHPDQEESSVPRNWVIFVANPAFSKIGIGPDRHMSYTGHIFVILATEDLNRQETSIDSYGFYPDDKSSSGALRAVLNVPGTLLDNLTGPEAGSLTPDTRIFSVQITGFQHVSAFKAIVTKYPHVLDEDRKAQEDFDGKGLNVYGPTYTNYSLLGSNCVGFVDAVASAVGLKTPSLSGTALTPNGYLNALEAMNISGPPGQGDQKIYMRLAYAYSPSGEPTGYYEGTTDETGKYHGHGLITAPSGVRYDLNFTHGRPDGPAHFYFPDGGELTGTLKDGTLSNGVYIDLSGGPHSASLNPDGSINFGDQSSSNGASLAGESGAASGRGGEHQAGAGGGAKGDHPLGADHWSLGSHDMGETHLGDIHPSH